ncbi:hypothetical protein [Dyella flagellata]|uniref:Uncharacterized protein n=1 Tax=Dyella flagellata TaxID=1867833 RepID=A0ABQ5X894_9GAMM|nr:hypothetical protein [Dyella flagellata]GLQ86788.1 hypothetical protein GCM10007898_03540 [Dyella flagellata]
MALAYDIVNTTSYIPEDGLALSLKGTRSMFVARVELTDFALDCEVADPRTRIGEILDACEATLATHAALLEDFSWLELAIPHGLDQFKATYGSATRASA